MIYWCDECNIPIINNEICSICGSKTRKISNDIRPVFIEEKKIISIILGKNIVNSSVWNKGSVNYIIDGQNIRVNYVNLFKDDNAINEIREKYMNQTVNFDKILEINQFEYVFHDKNLYKFIKANEQHIRNLEYSSQDYILKLNNKLKDRNVIPTISFSGGKDSTVVSNLIRETYGDQKIIHIFGDTTLEFKTTYNYVNRFKSTNVFTPIIVSRSEKKFFELCEEFGPPSRLERWCCTIFKTSPISENVNILADNENSLSFLGIRASESVQRSNYEKTRLNSKISRQIVSMPIFEWLDVDIWLYLLYKKLDFNAAYTLGFTRVGCWCCPNNSTRSDFFMKLYFKEEYDRWYKLLVSYAKKAGIEDYDVYVNHGKWKSRRGLRGLEKRSVDLKQEDCKLNDDAKVYFLKKDVKEDLIEFFKPFGETTKIFESEDLSIFSVGYQLDDKDSNFKIYLNINSKTIKIEPIKVKNISLFYQRVECQLRKYEFCIRCMACDSVCPSDAIRTANNNYRIIEENCVHCLKCVAHFNGGCLRVEKHKSKI